MIAYYVADGETVTGPFAEPAVDSMVRSGQITLAAQVCLEGTEEWMPVRTVLARMAASPPELPPTLAPVWAGAEREAQYQRQKKSEVVAVIIGLVVPFGGQLYAGNDPKAGLWCALSILGLFFAGLGLIPWLISVCLAPSAVTAANQKLAASLGL